MICGYFIQNTIQSVLIRNILNTKCRPPINFQPTQVNIILNLILICPLLTLLNARNLLKRRLMLLLFFHLNTFIINRLLIHKKHAPLWVFYIANNLTLLLNHKILILLSINPLLIITQFIRSCLRRKRPHSCQIIRLVCIISRYNWKVPV